MNLTRLSRKPANQGFTFVELALTVGVVALMGVGIIQALIMCQKFGATSRLLTNARAITQRNIDAAMEAGFTPIATPPVLTDTAANGDVCDDDGGSPTENISVLLSGTGSSAAVLGTVVSGTLRRFVSRLPSSFFPSDVVSGTNYPVVKNITFQVDYDYGSHHFTYSQSTVRAQDTQQ